MAWWRLRFSSPSDRPLQWLIPTAATVSLSWLLVGSLYPAVVGGPYGWQRTAIVDGNFALMFIAAVGAFSARPKMQVWTGWACIMLGLIWAFVAAINATV
jgi:hypothetical protein